MFWVYDNLLRDSVAEDVHDRIKRIPLSYDYRSSSVKEPKVLPMPLENEITYGKGTTPSKRAIQPHWHTECGHTEDVILQNNFEYLLPIYEEAKIKFKTPLKLHRSYINAHTYGVEPYTHTDTNDFTFIYYPRLDWEPEWLGGTALWDKEKINIIKYCNYVGNRLFIFHGHTNHQAMPIARCCVELRPVIVFKTMRDEELLLQRLKDSL